MFRFLFQFPILEMSTVEHNDKHHRSKRYANNVCSETERIDGCCRYPLRVDFIQFGWDWVIAPTGYQANYCSGECRYRHLDNNPQAYLLQQVPDDTGPCCTPSKYYPLAMLYFDHQHTVLYTFMQKMIVDRCGCAWENCNNGFKHQVLNATFSSSIVISSFGAYISLPCFLFR